MRIGRDELATKKSVQSKRKLQKSLEGRIGDIPVVAYNPKTRDWLYHLNEWEKRGERYGPDGLRKWLRGMGFKVDREDEFARSKVMITAARTNICTLAPERINQYTPANVVRIMAYRTLMIDKARTDKRYIPHAAKVQRSEGTRRYAPRIKASIAHLIQMVKCPQSDCGHQFAFTKWLRCKKLIKCPQCKTILTVRKRKGD